MSTLIDYTECAKLGVATIYEASRKEGLIDLPLQQLVPRSRVAGPARTVRCGQDDNLMVHAVIERIRPGDVIVLTMPEPRAVALVGDLLATQMVAAGAVGLLVDAAVRDAEDLATMGFPIWAHWIRVRGATKKIVGELDVPVTVGGATIAPGDLVVLDTDGACAVAQGRIDDVLAASRKRFENETTVRERYARGERSYDINDLRKIVLAGGA
jgi:4-hydroxy-4-methyl-2-oxoglutarate aldolase